MSEFKVLDSGKREEFATGSVRDTEEGKGRFDLLPTLPLRRLACLYQAGAAKYGDGNWKRGQRLGRYLSSLFRHLMAVMELKKDEDHCSSIAWNAFAFIWTANEIEQGRLPAELDDIGWTTTPVRIKQESGESLRKLAEILEGGKLNIGKPKVGDQAHAG